MAADERTAQERMADAYAKTAPKVADDDTIAAIRRRIAAGLYVPPLARIAAGHADKKKERKR